MARADLLLEIGSEELPAGYVGPALDELGRRVEAFLTDRGLAFERERTATFATPRRLAVRVHGVELEQPRRTETRTGPPVQAAFDADGNPTKAAVGFARSAGIEPTELKRVDSDKGQRIAAEVTTGGARTRDLLLGDLDLRELVQLGFPKTMRWIPGDDLRYARPIRWLVCLLGPEVVPLRLAHLEAGRVTRGHRTLAPGSVELDEPGVYERALETAGVIADPRARRSTIDSEARRVAAEAGGRLHEAEDLLDEVTHLVEHPTPVLGSIQPERVEQLPPEVIVTAMRSHQRYFSVEREDGSLLPHFITFRDGGERGLDNVVEGNERVLRARLDDALFYWNEDRALSSDEKVERLERVVWLEGFGSIGDKCERVAGLAVELAGEVGAEVDLDRLRRSARLCKTDLATEMIRDGKEFTRLQGTIGRYYALEAGEAVEVADAIREHLFPRSASDRLPEGPLGTLVAVADRLDSIAGCVLAGFAPTGGQDPYALRRQALAVIRILQDRGWNLQVEEWTARALSAHPRAEVGRDEAAGIIVDLFWGRLETVLSDLPAEIVRGVLSVSDLDPVENVRAARALAGLQESEAFGRLLDGAKRCRNILVKEDRLAEEALEGPARAAALRETAAVRWERWRTTAGSGAGAAFDPGAFTDEAERALHRAVVERLDALETARSGARYADLYAALAELGPPIDRYFDEVLVNAEDPQVRANRLGFLEEIHYLFTRFADLSRIAPR